MESIKAVGVEVITHPIASPPLPPTGVGCVATSVGPAHPEVSGLCCNKGQRLIHDQLVVPLPVLSRAITDSQEDVGTHAVGKKKQNDCLRGGLEWRLQCILSADYFYECKCSTLTAVCCVCVCMCVCVYLLTWLIRRVCSNRSLPGSRLSQIRCWLERTATPWHTHSEHNTSRT